MRLQQKDGGERPARWVESTRLLGLGLLVLATATAIGPDWPMSAAELAQTARRWPEQLVPSGRIAGVPSSFTWDWEGPAGVEFELVVLDRELAERVVLPVGRATHWLPAAPEQGILAELTDFYWFVRARTRWGVATSGLVAVRVEP
jgi:hypothetical protein